MSLSVLIIVLLTCSNLYNCSAALPVRDDGGKGGELKVEAANINNNEKPLIVKPPAPPEGNAAQGENKVENPPEPKVEGQNQPESKPEEHKQQEKKPENEAEHGNNKQTGDVNNGVKPVNNNVAVDTKPKTELKYHKKINHNATEMDSSTLKRLVLVLVALSIVFMMYLAFKTYRFWSSRLRRIFSKTSFFTTGHSSRYHQLMDWRRDKRSHVMVSKYGVRTRRSDLEMRPLPLDEEDEDETVFDLGNINNR